MSSLDPPAPRPPITLRFSQLTRILGIELDRDEVLRILRALGLDTQQVSPSQATLQAPSWRRDLTREIDLIEEVARIHGYDEIPEDVGVPMAPSHRRDSDRVLHAVRNVLLAAGFHEAMTASIVDDKTSQMFSPWTDAQPLRCSMPMLRGADCLRRSLLPSLLESRRVNESLANETIELFETAKIYLPRSGPLPDEQPMLALTSGRTFHEIKGILESMRDALHIADPLEVTPTDVALLDPLGSCQLKLGGEVLGYLGTLSEDGLKAAALRKPTTVAELKLAVLHAAAQLVPQYRPLSPFPAVVFDFNFIVDEAVRWVDLEQTVSRAGGQCLEEVVYKETYRDPQRDGADRKRLLLSVRLRSAEQTLTGDRPMPSIKPSSPPASSTTVPASSRSVGWARPYESLRSRNLMYRRCTSGMQQRPSAASEAQRASGDCDLASSARIRVGVPSRTSASISLRVKPKQAHSGASGCLGYTGPFSSSTVTQAPNQLKYATLQLGVPQNAARSPMRDRQSPRMCLSMAVAPTETPAAPHRGQ